jgi:hypothetical protein
MALKVSTRFVLSYDMVLTAKGAGSSLLQPCLEIGLDKDAVMGNARIAKKSGGYGREAQTLSDM